MSKVNFVAIIKLDPIESNSNGGVVEWIGHWEIGENNNGVVIPQPYQNTSGIIKSGYKMIVLHEWDSEALPGPINESIINPKGVKVGWILQDKTNILRDPNI
jgi:hypothetical protein